MNRRISLFDARQTGRMIHTAYINQFFGINDCRIGRQRHRATGITGSTAARNNGKPQLDAIAHQVTHFLLIGRIQHHKRIFDPPIGGISHMRYAGKTVKTDIILAGMFGE